MMDNSIEPAVRRRQELGRLAQEDVDYLNEAARYGAASQKSASQSPVALDAVADKHKLYVTEKGSARIYFADYQQKAEVMRASESRITTSKEDRQTITAMLDLAKERGWESIRLRGTESFKREAWVQAEIRGIATDGYKPQATDLQEVQRLRAAANRDRAWAAANSQPNEEQVRRQSQQQTAALAATA